MENQATYDYIIIGSGFGGSVSALRLSEKGYKVAVLEKGLRWNPKDFPKTSRNLRKYLWMPGLRFYGIQVLTWMKHVFILHGAGVGGGSLVYANNLLIPEKKVFDKPEWGQTDFYNVLLPFYQIAQKMLGAVKSPSYGKADGLLAEIGKELTGTDTFHLNEIGVFFGKEPGKTYPDPFFEGKGPERTSCTFCSACMVGCRDGGKNTLDKNYLYFAEKNGVEIFAETVVEKVEETEYGYKITTKKLKSFGLKKNVYYAKGVVFSGGVMGTVKLLLKCKKNGYLPRLSEKIGNYIRTNAEALIGVMANDKKAMYSDQTAITSGIYPDAETHMEIVRYNKGSNTIGLLATILVEGGGKYPRWMNFFKQAFLHPLTFLRTMLPVNFAARSSVLLVMRTVEDIYLNFTYKRKWWLLGKNRMNSVIPKGFNKISAHIPLASLVAKKLSEKMNATPMSLYTEALFDIPTTAHILGGARMGADATEGVIDFNGKVFGYENMYVADGSVVPANLGVNPSLTITALSEYIMSRIPDKK